MIRPSVRIEALRLARLAVKQAIIDKGAKLSDFHRNDITKAALELIKQDPHYANQARVNLKTRELLKRSEK